MVNLLWASCQRLASARLPGYKGSAFLARSDKGMWISSRLSSLLNLLGPTCLPLPTRKTYGSLQGLHQNGLYVLLR